MNNYLPFCIICGAGIDQNTGLCLNPNCPNCTVSENKQQETT